MGATRYDDFLSFAINNEIEAAGLYERYAARAKTTAQAKLLTRLAAMERNHEEQLTRLKAGLPEKLGGRDRLIDLHIGDFLADRPLTEESSVEDLAVFAIKAEQKAFELYDALAALEHDDLLTKELLSRLAAEEKKHKYDLETEFEREFLREN
jgi:rubrerythrin